jgi:hypothetical protein
MCILLQLEKGERVAKIFYTLPQSQEHQPHSGL